MGRESASSVRGAVSRALLLTLCATAAAAAQTATPARPDGESIGPPAPPRRIVFDRIEAIIGDRVVLESTVQRELEPNLQEGLQLPAAVLERKRNEILTKIVQDELWVQQGKVLGKESPDAFEQFVERSVDERMDEMVQSYGSKLRTIDELKAIGQSWSDTREAYRNELLSQIAQQQALYQRLGANWQLIVTPEEMLRFYDENQPLFAARCSTAVAWVAFPATGEGGATACLQNARLAAEAWRADPIDASDLAERFGGTALPLNQDVRPDDTTDSRAGFIKDFARTGAEGDVSEPLPIGSNLFVMRIVHKLDRSARGFADQEVQNVIRERLAKERFDRLRETIARRKLRTLIYQDAGDMR